MKVSGESPSSQLQQIQQKEDNLFEKLASGKKVNSALDDAAAQQIIDRLTTQVEGNRQAINNVYDGISVAQIAEGGLSTINDDVNRIRELTLQSGSGILNDSDRRAIQSEITQLQENIVQSIEQTNFAGKSLLLDAGSHEFQTGANANQSISVNTQDVAAQLNDVLTIDITSGTSVEDALNAADSALESIGGARGEFEASLNRLESTARSLIKGNVSAAEARSRIQSVDYAQAVSERTINDIRSQASLTVQAQANQQQSQVLSLLS
ncbi:flagellin [Alteromonas mediterranea]|uniref:flagellin n=1 Tax=Alteromonas mediterranea TaxID=314275 RepID=UPI002FDF809B